MPVLNRRHLTRLKQPCLTIQMSPLHAAESNVVGGHGHWFRRHCIPLRQRLKHFPKRRIFIWFLAIACQRSRRIIFTNFWIHRMPILLKALIFFAAIGSKLACAKSAWSIGISLMNVLKNGCFTNLLNCKKLWDLSGTYRLIFASELAASGGVCGAKQLSPFWISWKTDQMCWSFLKQLGFQMKPFFKHWLGTWSPAKK